MSAPDEAMVEAVASEEVREAVRRVLADGFPMTPIYRVNRVTDAALSVPVVRDALARDAQVAEIVGDFPYGATSSQMVALAEEVLDVHRWTAP